MNVRHDRSSESQDTLQRLEFLLHAQQAAILALAQRLDRLTDMMRTEKSYGIAAQASAVDQEAIAFARAGLSAEDIARRCGLAPPDADLLRDLYWRGGTTANVTGVSSPT